MIHTDSKKLFCVAMVAACLAVYASPVGAEVRIGIKGGASIATQSASGSVFPGIERSTRDGFAIGAVFEFPLRSHLQLRAEPMYVQKGSEIDWPAAYDFNDNTLELDCLELALNLKAALDYGIISPFMFAGLSIDYFLSDENVMEIDGSRIDADMGAIDLGLDFGAGAGIRLSDDWSIAVDARYSLGLIDADDNDGSSFKNRAWLVLAGLMFEL